MKKILSVLIILLLIAGLSGCKKDVAEGGTDETQEPESGQTETQEPQDNIDFRAEAEEMSPGDAQAYLQSEEADQTSVQYKEAVYTVNETVAESIISDARENTTQTDELNELFDGIYFQFLEGDQFGSETVRRKVFARGTYELEESGWYRFTFYDRTLAQAAVSLDNDHSLSAYTEVLELLLSDPNVTVKTLLE